MSEDRYTQVLKAMSASVHEFAARLPPPQKVPTTDSFVFRYVERLPEQAIVQKLARYVSTLAAARLLMQEGFVQEQATLQRVLDDLHEDIVFIALALCSDDMTDRHKQFLDAFYEEEFDLAKGTPLVQKRQMVSRDKIRAYNARVGSSHDPSGSASATRKVTKAYSGYVHAASPHIMDMYGGRPSRFHMTGMLGTPLHDDHRYDLWNYFYRGILAIAIASKAFGDVANYERVRRFALQFEAERGIAPD